MLARRWIWGVGAIGVAVLAAVALWRLNPPASGPPNVLFVLWDTVRADHLSLYGHDQPTTPHLERFAEGGVVYDNVFSPGMWTVPSHGSMFTGLPPSTHGASFDWRWLDHHHTTMAEWFGEHGYDTFAFSANPNLSRRGANLLQGFDVVQTSWSAMWWPLVRKITNRKLIPEDASTEISPAFRGGKPGNAYYNGALATERALTQWLDTRDGDAPFFAYLNYMEAHKPRIPARKFRKLVIPEPLRSIALRTDLSFDHQLGYGYGAIDYTSDEIAAANGVYDAAIRELDFFFGRLMVVLKRRDLQRNTIVVVTSDHGETLGEHHRFGHRHGVYQTLLHVPLVIRHPGGLQPGRVTQPVTTMDLFATLTELAGLPMAPDTLSRSLLERTQREAVYSEVLSYDAAGLALAARLFPGVDVRSHGRTYRTVRQGDHKYTVDDRGHGELFDLHEDPLETTAIEDPAIESKLKDLMTTWWQEIPAYDPSLRAPNDRPVVQGKDKEMLEALGYMVDE